MRRTPRGLMVPFLWRLEIGNVLLMAERRGKITPERRVAHLGYLAALPVHVDQAGAGAVWDDTMRLAQRHRPSLYDAVYLELALRLDAGLATFDAALARAAVAEGVAAA